MNAARSTPIWLPSSVVTGEHELSSGGPGLGDRCVHGPGIFGVSHVVGNIRKIAVGRTLRCQNVDFLEAGGLEELSELIGRDRSNGSDEALDPFHQLTVMGIPWIVSLEAKPIESGKLRSRLQDPVNVLEQLE